MAVHAYPRVFCDETRMPVLEKGQRRTHTGQFWAHAIDDRPGRLLAWNWKAANQQAAEALAA
jgi:hypothetical protein